MVNITLSVSEELKKKMDLFAEINWSAIAREAIGQRIIMLEKFREFTKNGKFTEEDALQLGRKVNKSLTKKHYS